MLFSREQSAHRPAYAVGMSLWRGAEHGSVMFHVPAGHYHRAGSSSVERGHPTPDMASAMGAGFDVTFERREPGVPAATIRCFTTETVMSLQKKVFAATNLPPAQQALSINGVRMSTGNLRDFGVGPGARIVQAPLIKQQPSGVPLTPQVPTARPSTKPRTPPPTTPRDGLSMAEMGREMNSPRGARSDTLRYDPSWQNRAGTAGSPRAGGLSTPGSDFPTTPGGSLSGRVARPPTATERALASRRGTQSKAMPWSGQYKASSSQGFGIVNPNDTLTPRHYGDFPPSAITQRQQHVAMAGGRGGAAQVEQIHHPQVVGPVASLAATATGQLAQQDHVAVAMQPGSSGTHTSSGQRLPTAGPSSVGDPRLGTAAMTPFTPKSLSESQEYYAVKWGAMGRGVTPRVMVTGNSWRKA